MKKEKRIQNRLVVLKSWPANFFSKPRGRNININVMDDPREKKVSFCRDELKNVINFNFKRNFFLYLDLNK